MSRQELILPAATFDDLRRQVVGVARNSHRLRAAGQHLKRGILLYGPPGVGKTHSVRYLISELVGTTVVELTGETLHGIREACSVARTLQPAMIVVEDVDLIAEERSHYGGETPLLFTLLNEMDGLDEDADVVFLLPPTGPICSSLRSPRDPDAWTRPSTSSYPTASPDADLSSSTGEGSPSTGPGSTPCWTEPTVSPLPS